MDAGVETRIARESRRLARLDARARAVTDEWIFVDISRASRASTRARVGVERWIRRSIDETDGARERENVDD